jgi:hypothetical protein
MAVQVGGPKAFEQEAIAAQFESGHGNKQHNGEPFQYVEQGFHEMLWAMKGERDGLCTKKNGPVRAVLDDGVADVQLRSNRVAGTAVGVKVRRSCVSRTVPDASRFSILTGKRLSSKRGMFLRSSIGRSLKPMGNADVSQ